MYGEVYWFVKSLNHLLFLFKKKSFEGGSPRLNRSRNASAHSATDSDQAC